MPCGATRAVPSLKKLCPAWTYAGHLHIFSPTIHPALVDEFGIAVPVLALFFMRLELVGDPICGGEESCRPACCGFMSREGRSAGVWFCGVDTAVGG